jgi:hypothetical protein
VNKKPFSWRRGFTLSLFVGVLLACGIRQDEFDCENAAAHLAECCPGFDAKAISCTYSDACTTTYPALDPAQSDCIRQASCESLRAAGVCDRAAQLAPGGTSTGMTSPSVCPPAPVPDAGPIAPSPPLVEAGISCSSAQDCPRGVACCITQATPFVVECSATPCFLQVCAASAECGAGRTCERVASLPQGMLCVRGDASPDASPDGPDEASGAGSDTAFDTAPDAAAAE